MWKPRAFLPPLALTSLVYMAFIWATNKELTQQRASYLHYQNKWLTTHVFQVHTRDGREEPSSSTWTSKRITKSLEETARGLNEYVLFFNRIPKTGSEMLVLLLQWLEGRNLFKHVRLRNGNVRRLDRIQQSELIEEVMEQVQTFGIPLSFDRHVYLLNFTSFGRQSPTYINMVRDPVEKALSRFYYKRVTPDPNSVNVGPHHAANHNVDPFQNFQQCYSAKSPECYFIDGQSYDLTIPYFCGHHSRCMILNDAWALSEAKRNVDTYFPVVGVLEDLNASLAILEHRLPLFFRGIQQIYHQELLGQLENNAPHTNRNRQRPHKLLGADLERELRKNLSMEYDFYHFIRQRLQTQHQQILEKLQGGSTPQLQE